VVSQSNDQRQKTALEPKKTLETNGKEKREKEELQAPPKRLATELRKKRLDYHQEKHASLKEKSAKEAVQVWAELLLTTQ